MSEHEWAQKTIAAYVADGLEPEERERLETHLERCAECAAAVEETLALDRKLLPLFAAAHPGPDMEDRLVKTINALPPLPRPKYRPIRLSGRAMTILGTAAAILLALVGVAVENFDRESQPSAMKMSVDLQGGTILGYGSSTAKQGASPPQTKTTRQTKDEPGNDAVPFELFTEGTTDAKGVRKPFSYLNDLARDFDKSNRKLSKRILEETELPSYKEKDEKKYDGEDRKGSKDKEIMKSGGGLGSLGGGGLGGLGGGSSASGSGGSSLGGQGSVVGKVTSIGSDNLPALTNNGVTELNGKPRDRSGPKFDDAAEKHYKDLAVLRDSKSPKPGESLTKTPSSANILGERIFSEPPPPGTLQPPLGSLPPPALPPPAPPSELPPLRPSEKKNEDTKKEEPAENPREPGKTEPPTKTPKNPEKEDLVNPGAEAPNPQPEPKPPASNRKVIYTAELEFEVQSFDAALDTVKRLKGATTQIATVNKDKLPNGKMRGVIVLRVLPDNLEGLIGNLIAELTKAKKGELRNQHLFSEDITKHYTDLESQLKAKRVMEERLISIIKNEKGTVKDLLQVEKEMGTVRTRIEEIEGELRYYANLVSLSTLTIKLYEKDIGSAAQIMQCERIQAGIETEDVEKNYNELKSKAEKKGRVTFSDYKEIGAGQFRGILNFEVPQALRNEFRDELRRLGHQARFQSDTLQLTDDGSSPTKKTSVVLGDTQFVVTIYNLANMTPQEAIILRLAVTDVKAAFDELRDKIDSLKGLARMTNFQFDDKDRNNISAQVDFDVNRTKEADVVAVMGGETLQRNVIRAPSRDDVTNARVRYLVTLVDADSLLPRDKRILRIVAGDVQASYKKLRDDLKKIKLREIVAQDSKQEATFVFSYKRDDEAAVDKALKAAGDLLTRKDESKPEGPDVTGAKVLIHLTLVSADAVTPRDTFGYRIAATDVKETFAKLHKIVAKAQPRIIKAEVGKDPQDMVVNKGELSFDVPSAAAAELRTELETVREVVFQQVVRAGEGDNVSAAKTRFVIEVADVLSTVVRPRETVRLKIAVENVAAVYAKLRKTLGTAKARVFADPLNTQDLIDVKATFEFAVLLTQEGAVKETLDRAGEVLSSNVVPTQETANVSDAKVVYHVEFVDIFSRSVLAQERTERKIAATDVSASFEKLRQALKTARVRIYGGGKIDDKEADLFFAYLRSDEPTVFKALEEAGETFHQAQEKIEVTDKKVLVTDKKVLMTVKLLPAATSIAPRQSATLTLEVSDVPGTLGKFDTMVKEVNGRIERPTWTSKTEVTAVYLVPLASYEGMLAKIRATGIEHSFEPILDTQAPDGKLAQARFKITLTNTPPLVTRDDSLGSQMYQSVSVSLKYLFKSLGLVITGLLVVGPWLPVGVVLFLVVRRTWRSEPAAPTSGGTPSGAEEGHAGPPTP